MRTLIITIDPIQRDVFFTQMQKFAEKHTIKIAIHDVEVKVSASGKGCFLRCIGATSKYLPWANLVLQQ